MISAKISAHIMQSLHGYRPILKHLIEDIVWLFCEVAWELFMEFVSSLFKYENQSDLIQAQMVMDMFWLFIHCVFSYVCWFPAAHLLSLS